MEEDPVKDVILGLPGVGIAAAVGLSGLIAGGDCGCKEVIKGGAIGGGQEASDGGAEVGRVGGDVVVNELEGLIPGWCIVRRGWTLEVLETEVGVGDGTAGGVIVGEMVG